MIGARYQAGKGRWSIVCQRAEVASVLEAELRRSFAGAFVVWRGAALQVVVNGRRRAVSRAMDMVIGEAWRRAVSWGDCARNGGAA